MRSEAMFPTSRARRTILVTGGTGVLGQALLEKLSASTILCLVHRTPLPPIDKGTLAARNIVAVSGDISLPGLGLDPGTFRALAKRIDCIVHAAAVTNFAVADEVINRTNVVGTENVLRLAAAAQVPVHYVSTAFVRPNGDAEGSDEPNSYVVSKWEAERTVRESGLPNTILRSSIVAGDSRTGVIAQFQGLHLIAGLLLRGFLPIVPASVDSYVDFVAQDVIADVVAALVEREEVGGEYWLTAGDQAPLLGRLFEICAEQAHDLVGREIELPRVVTPDVFDRLVRPVFLPALPSGIRRQLNQALQLSQYFGIDRPFPSSLRDLQQRLSLPPLPDPEVVFVRSLEYWAARNRSRNESRRKVGA